MKKGFTLIELSVVICIIGLLTGGIIVGRNLIRSAEVKATISQVEKYRSAVSAFDEKYGSLPGDISSAKASRFGFTARNGTMGQGNENGLIEGPSNFYTTQGGGETGLFWVDLTTANGLNINLIDGAFSTATSTGTPTVGVTTFSYYMPPAKLGRGHFFYVYNYNNINYFGLLALTQIVNGGLTGFPALPVWEAYEIDNKTDDGLPTTGMVVTNYLNLANVYAAAGGGGYGGGYVGGAAATPVPASNVTCYDNQNLATNPFQYSLTYANGNNNNCALSFAF